MAWRLAKSLIQLRQQINAAFPNRDKSSDGSIGDLKHASRKSDHNPNAAGVVTATDTDEDLSPTKHSIEDIITAIRKSRDPRVKYIIYEGRITVAGSNLQRWKKYEGVNPHNHHAHISVFNDPKLYDDDSPWSIGVEAAPPMPDPVNSKPTPGTNGALAPQPDGSQAGGPTPPPAPVVAVPALSASPSDKPAETAAEESTLSKIGNKVNAAYTAVGATVAGMVAWFSSVPGQIVLYIVIGVCALGGLYMLTTWVRALVKDAADRKDKRLAEEREFELKKIREAHVQEAQLYSMKSAADPNLQAVTIQSPPATEMPNSDTAA